MSKHPLVTVVTPTYNRAAYLPETIESILSQEYPNIEYIVLDDGSTDNTCEVLEKYNGQLRWESHRNMGETCTVNRGVSMAEGEYVIIVNSDDPILPDLVQESIAFLETHPDVLVVYPDWIMIDENGKRLRELRLPEYNYIEMLRWHLCQPGPGALIRRDAFLLAGGRNPDYRYVADFEFWLRLGLLGPFAHIAKTMATWRSHPGGASQAHKNVAMAEEHIMLTKGLYARLDLPQEVHRVRGQALSAAYYSAATACLPAARATARRYFLTCLRYSPLYPFLYPHRSAHSILVILETIILPAFIRSLLVTVFHKLADNNKTGRR